jgi:hypothetical protein
MTVVLAAMLCPAAPAQAPAPGRPFDSFGAINASDWLARLDNLAIEMQNDPSARAYIVAHPEKYTLLNWPARRTHWARGYLIKSRGIEPARIFAAVGGFRAKTEFDLWVVRAGGGLPFEPLDYALALAGERAPVKVDVFKYYPPPPAEGEISYNYGDGASPYETLAALMRADPSLRLSVIGYAARANRRHGADRRLAAEKKRQIMTAHALPAARVVALGGGRREFRTVELWLVPPGAPLPAPSREDREERF